MPVLFNYSGLLFLKVMKWCMNMELNHFLPTRKIPKQLGDNVITRSIHILLARCQARLLCDVCHEKTDLKVFVVVIPKEGLAQPANPSLLMTPTTEYNL